MPTRTPAPLRWQGRALWGAGEAALTLGAVLLLLVAHQLWWTNLQAHAAATDRVTTLERQWDRAGTPATPTPDTSDQSAADGGPAPGNHTRTTGRTRTGTTSPQPSQAYAVLRIPRIGVTAPIAEGISRAKVLNHGYAGHYPHTAQPGQPGNLALAGHRNTHGEPFRRIDRLRPGDTLVVETATTRYTYVVRQTVPRTTPADGTVIAPVPHSTVHPRRHMTGPGHYITLTTCTPEFTSAYRLVVWGGLAAAEPR
ncbi:class E sortase [Actinacidiphila glaucinigra]|uniref:class E sortase n=1 Tax=Actinacidiphila glaucinigra TaxID=235986 RepID=UPI003253B803